MRGLAARPSTRLTIGTRGASAGALAICLATALALALAHPGALQAETTQLSSSARLSELGWGPVRVGMTVEEAEQAAGRRLDLSYAAGDGSCGQGSFVRGPRYHSVLVTDGIVRRIAAYPGYRGRRLRPGRVRTTRGVRIGTTERAVFRKYGRLQRERHAYVRGEYLTYQSPHDPDLAIVFETNQRNRVIAIRAGRRPEVEYIEGCA